MTDKLEKSGRAFRLFPHECEGCAFRAAALRLRRLSSYIPFIQSFFLLFVFQCRVPAADNAFNSARSADFIFSINGFTEDEPFKNPVSVFYDGHDELIYIADTGLGEVGVFNKDGFLLRRFGREQGLEEPLGIAVDKNGNVYISDRITSKITVLNMLGRQTMNYKIPQGPKDSPTHPGRIALDGSGRLYAIDDNNRRILVFNRQGDFESVWDGGDEFTEWFSTPADIEISPDGRMYVVNSTGDPMKVFSISGEMLLSLSKEQKERSSFRFAAGVDVGEEGEVWIVDSFGHNVSVFDKNLNFRFSFGGQGAASGRFLFPVDIALDTKGKRAFVLEKVGKRLQVFSYGQVENPVEGF